eukprot:5874079-Pyramimonas_sp.AAC.1
MNADRTNNAIMLKIYVSPKDWDDVCFLRSSWGLPWSPLGFFGVLVHSLSQLKGHLGHLGGHGESDLEPP